MSYSVLSDPKQRIDLELPIETGGDFSFYVYDSDGVTLQPIIGSDIIFTMRKQYEDTVPTLRKTSSLSTNIEISTTETGKFILKIKSSDLPRSLELGKYFYDIMISLSEEKMQRVCYGIITLVNSVYRSTDT